MPSLFDDLGQGQIEALTRARPGLHGNTKARRRRLRAVDRHNKRGSAETIIMGIDKPILEEHPVLHTYGGQFTSSCSEKSVARRIAGVAENLKFSVALHLEQPDLAGVKEFLPALRPYRIAKQRSVVPFLDAVTSGVLFFSPTNGEIFQLA
jgi:hypothetical protein